VTTFFLTRHAQSTGGPGDACLTTSGVAQARAIGEELRARPITRVYTSPLCRAVETAREIAAALAITTVEVDARLRERANWGDVPEQSWDEFFALWERSNGDRDFVIPGGVSARVAGERFDAFLRDTAAVWPGAEIVAVSHGGAIVDFLGQYFDEAALLERRPGLRQMAWCAVTDVVYETDGVRVGCLADWPHGCA
jgi:2,3-bisphosphoglycerate-dependent phosphoglycerate mutase/probable phosphoglycerate mutase